MTLIAKRPCNFGGTKFYIGDQIPAELVENPEKQESLGVIAIASKEVGGGKAPTASIQALSDETPINIPIKGEKGFSELTASYHAVKEAFSILQMDASEAKAAIAKIEDDDTLILLNAADKRKSVAPAVVARHEELAKAESEAETETDEAKAETEGDADGNEGV